jgi:3D (Asp-Asp-Asp) domain-containing protein
MIHPELKPLVWGRHLQHLLTALEGGPPRPQRAPRIVGTVPGWFRRVSAVLTLVGIVGGLRWIDQAVFRPADPGQTGAPLAATAWNDWTRSSLTLPLDALARQNSEVTDTKRTVAVPTADQEHRFQKIEITAYCRDTTSARPTTASNTVACPGTIALSRDLLRTFTPHAPFDFGDKVLIPGVGVFEVRDTMNPRWKEKADLWFESRDQAKDWGCRTVFVTRVEESAPTIIYGAQNTR